jgi:hypothetical protein
MNKLTMLLIAFTLTIIAVFVLSLTVKASEDKKITITDEAYTVSYDFTEVTATASVPANACNLCIRDRQPSECLEICDIIID